MTKNLQTSGRKTRWDRFLLNVPFQKGFADQRAQRSFADEYEVRSVEWQWFYETGRLFAAAPESRRWKAAPTKITKALIAAYRAMDGRLTL